MLREHIYPVLSDLFKPRKITANNAVVFGAHPPLKSYVAAQSAFLWHNQNSTTFSVLQNDGHHASHLITYLKLQDLGKHMFVSYSSMHLRLSLFCRPKPLLMYFSLASYCTTVLTLSKMWRGRCTLVTGLTSEVGGASWSTCSVSNCSYSLAKKDANLSTSSLCKAQFELIASSNSF